MTYEECQTHLFLSSWANTNEVYWSNGHANITLYSPDRRKIWGMFNYYPGPYEGSSKHFDTYEEGIDYLNTL